MPLHWLPVRQRITYKLCCLMHGVVYGHTPSYLSDMVVPVSHLPGRAHLHQRNEANFTVFGSRSFSVAAAQAWNELPATYVKSTHLSHSSNILRRFYLKLHTHFNNICSHQLTCILSPFYITLIIFIFTDKHSFYC